MNVGGTLATALLRSWYLAVIAGASAAVAAAQQGLDTKAAILTGCAGGLAILAARGLGEGAYDSNRNAAGDVKPSDVTPNP